MQIVSHLPRIVRLTDPTIGLDRMIQFTIETDDGESSRAEIAIDDVAMLVTFLLQAVVRGCEIAGIEEPSIDEATTPIDAIPLKGIAIAQREEAGEFDIVLRLPGLWFPVRVDSTKMGELATQFASMARLLSTGGTSN